jgi:uncharacterized protein YjiS (DUF1127 family)
MTVRTDPVSGVSRRRAPRETSRRFVAACIDAFVAWEERVRSRRRLAALDDRALRDIGLNRADVWVETRKPFWKP